MKISITNVIHKHILIHIRETLWCFPNLNLKAYMHNRDDATVVIHPNLILKERDIFSSTLTINIDGKTV
jgi:hypothetical protein